MTRRILVIDGAMGTLIQGHRLEEAGYRGERFADRAILSRDVRGDHDLLSLTQPEIVRSIHDEYLAAGADIIETNTFTATAIAQADFGADGLAREMNAAAASLARAAADAAEAPIRAGRAGWPGRSALPTGPPRSHRTSTTPAPATSPSTSWPTRTPKRHAA